MDKEHAKLAQISLHLAKNDQTNDTVSVSFLTRA